jgi:predicted DNA-binding ribbon-helix-helix protein
LKEKYKLRVFGSRVLSRVLDIRRMRSSRRLEKIAYEELHNLYSSPDIIRMNKLKMIRLVGHVAHMGKKRNA